MDNPTGYGVPWYEPQDYEEMRLLLKDSTNMPLAYGDWLTRFEYSLKIIEERGQIPIRVKVKAPQFTAWCLSHGRKIETNELRNFLSFQAMHLSSEGG